MKRRDFLTATAVSATFPASVHAFAAPQPQTTEPEMPEWWKRLVSEVECLRDELAPHMGRHEMVAISEERLNALFALIETPNGGLV